MLRACMRTCICVYVSICVKYKKYRYIDILKDKYKYIDI